ncbi:FecR domain-containing protein [Thalassobaculum sp. OXR-137]|uniref:FecR family protein n=1 Tax=Thalassobaculum sp. OXR-137 TaxID=3100173 RepID=UPI002AC93BEC|nr:FecR domain-containing protein [Thalassobaculum sp. OXR-137]WPZ32366.1 FecR domain-containing protein [Thalassobaculum sp. OXR-137]
MTADRHDHWIAADWLVALRDRPDDPVLQDRFADWLSADPAHRDQWKAVVRTYRSLGAVERSGTATVVPLPNRRRRWLLGGAAAALVACLMLMLAPSLVRTMRADFVSGTAEVTRIVLPDGSVVQLAPNSALSVDYDTASRRIDLLDGIALFEVTPDPARPFSVSAGPATATAVGTAFEVRRLDGLEAVAVREGVVSVEAAPGAGGRRLKAGQSIRISGSGTAQLGAVLPAQIGIWTENLVTARERPVADLVAEIRRYYPGLIVLRGERLAAQPVTGIFDMSDPARALGLIAASQGADLHRFSPWLLILDGG